MGPWTEAYKQLSVEGRQGLLVDGFTRGLDCLGLKLDILLCEFVLLLLDFSKLSLQHGEGVLPFFLPFLQASWQSQ